jgi:hypothetical protein
LTQHGASVGIDEDREWEVVAALEQHRGAADGVVREKDTLHGEILRWTGAAVVDVASGWGIGSTVVTRMAGRGHFGGGVVTRGAARGAASSVTRAVGRRRCASHRITAITV